MPGRRLDMPCGEDEFRLYTQNFFALWCHLKERMAQCSLLSLDSIMLYVPSSRLVPPQVVDIETVITGAAARLPELMDTLDMQNIITVPENSGLLRYPFLEANEENAFFAEINLATDKALVLSDYDTGRVLEASPLYCQYTKSALAWKKDTQNVKRWDSSFLQRLYDNYLRVDPDTPGVIVERYEYKAEWCRNKGELINWVTSFQEIMTDSGRLRLAHVHQIGDLNLDSLALTA